MDEAQKKEAAEYAATCKIEHLKSLIDSLRWRLDHGHFQSPAELDMAKDCLKIYERIHNERTAI